MLVFHSPTDNVIPGLVDPETNGPATYSERVHLDLSLDNCLAVLDTEGNLSHILLSDFDTWTVEGLLPASVDMKDYLRRGPQGGPTALWHGNARLMYTVQLPL
jgi:hypothetical protein